MSPQQSGGFPSRVVALSALKPQNRPHCGRQVSRPGFGRGEPLYREPPGYHSSIAVETQLTRIQSVEPLDGFVLRPVFDDCTERQIDLGDGFWGPTCEPLTAAFGANRDLFRKVHVDRELGSIVWPNGADMDPDALHGDFEPSDAAATSGVLRAKP